MGKKITRHRPVIHSVQMDSKRDDFITCIGSGCKNIIAAYTRDKLCSRCKTN